MSYEIEKGVPIPEKARKRKYPFGQMEVGDSVWINRNSGAVSSAIAYYKLQGKRFTSRAETRNDKYGCRVWRIA